MKFKKIMLMLFVLFLTVGVVSAADDNQTDYVQNLQSDLGQSNDEVIAQEIGQIGGEINEENDDAVLGHSNSDVPLTKTVNEDDSSINVTKTLSPDSSGDYSTYYGEGFSLKYKYHVSVIKPSGTDVNYKDSTVQIRVYDGSSYKSYYFNIKNFGPAIYSGSGWVGCSNLKAGTFKLEAYLDGKYAFTKTLKVNPVPLAFEKYSSKSFEYKKNKYYKINIYNKKTYDVIKKTTFIVKIYTGSKYKTYKIKSYNFEENTYLKIPTKKLKVGNHKITITSEDKSYYGTFTSKIKIYKVNAKKTTTQKKKSKNWKSTTIKIKLSNYYGNHKKLKTGDTLETVYSSSNRQYDKGVYVQVISYDDPIHTKIKKVKFYFKNKKTGKLKIKTGKITSDKWLSQGKAKLISGYKPIKAKVWYIKR